MTDIVFSAPDVLDRAREAVLTLGQQRHEDGPVVVRGEIILVEDGVKHGGHAVLHLDDGARQGESIGNLDQGVHQVRFWSRM